MEMRMVKKRQWEQTNWQQKTEGKTFAAALNGLQNAISMERWFSFRVFCSLCCCFFYYYSLSFTTYRLPFCLFGRVSLSLFDDSSLSALRVCFFMYFNILSSFFFVYVHNAMVVGASRRRGWGCINGYGFCHESTSYRSFWIDFDCLDAVAAAIATICRRCIYKRICGCPILFYSVAVNKWLDLGWGERLIFDSLVTFAHWNNTHTHFNLMFETWFDL